MLFRSSFPGSSRILGSMLNSSAEKSISNHISVARLGFTEANKGEIHTRV